MAIVDESAISDRDFKQIATLVYDHCKITLNDTKKELVQARVMKRLIATGCRSFGEYIELLRCDDKGDEFTQLIDSISTNLTSFFRENKHFDYLSKRLFPEIVARKRRKGSTSIRGWSAGCSTGEEPYTIAITTAESIDLGQWDFKLLATDISTRVLKQAQEGFYDKSKASGLTPAIASKYFTSNKFEGRTMLHVSNQLRELIRFRHLNLMETWPFTGPFDFIFCRNVMIYFDKPTQEKLVQRYFDVLESGGVLFTGHSESLTGIKHGFKYSEPTIYVKP